MSPHTRLTFPSGWEGHPDYERAKWCAALSDLVYDERSKREWTEAEFAERAGVSLDYVEELEGSAVYPDPDVLVMLATVFGGRVAVGGRDEPYSLAFVA
ncbi:multiprotein-bridging factor 1 family protein [Nocardiopsis sp. NPDC050513]|uniref:multiprotein-bridging factor 1 family protein n=1 Tax=Nocardiopsis sp. NPDC050513 TaxID=3364338 RepID=UPI0037873279